MDADIREGVRYLPELIEVDALMVHDCSWRGRAAARSRRPPNAVATAWFVTMFSMRVTRDRRRRSAPYGTSELSAHLHFGASQPHDRCARRVVLPTCRADVDAFLEELIVRRELAVNFVVHRLLPPRGCPRWASGNPGQACVRDLCRFLLFRVDTRSRETHDPLWNAARDGSQWCMHNYLRMYWAKKLLEWSPDAATAFAIAVDLNDRL